MRRSTVGVLAHVDAGKTTLSEALLYQGGRLKKPGRVDHGDAFLDTDELERRRGITIFAKQAVLPLPGAVLTLLDTPGHVDFAAEAERTLSVLDCAVLVISGPAGVQSHTRTLWQLLARHQVPTFVFVNKMDLPGAEKSEVLAALNSALGGGFVDFSLPPEALGEELAGLDEAALEEYIDTGTVSEQSTAGLIAARRAFPCYFGSALKLQGIDELLAGLEHWAPVPVYPAAFGARVFKISRDEQGVRLTHIKVTGGSLKAKTLLEGVNAAGEPWQQKADALRLYSGAKFAPLAEAEAGTVCAVTGLEHTWPGEGLGAEQNGEDPALEPVLACEVLAPEKTDASDLLAKLRLLEQEDPLLQVEWNEAAGRVQVRLMGEVQQQVLAHLMKSRFGLEISFGPGSIVYKETIAAPVVGKGHFEPLRHYAEVHLLLEPGPRGSGLVLASSVSEDELDGNWQRLILSHLAERRHPGVLTGSSVTDMKITLAAGKAHLKHTEGGDFRQATFRALRQGLMQAENILLEPWYSFRLEVPAGNLGRAMADVQRMGGRFDPPETTGEAALLTGEAPVSEMTGYAAQVAAYTKGEGRLAVTVKGYEPCHNAEQVIAASGYDPERDTENPADSVFCSHGAGVVVPWREAASRMHVEDHVRLREDAPSDPSPVPARAARPAAGSLEEDAQLAAIFERTYGPAQRRELLFRSPKDEKNTAPSGPWKKTPEYLLVDGYNVIFDWPDLKALAAQDLSTAREALIQILCNYQGYHQCTLIVVFDAYRVTGGAGGVQREGGVWAVYTKEAETADAYIEKVTYELGKLEKERRVRAVTSDGAEQLILLGHGTLRVSSRMFRREMEATEREIAQIIAQHNAKRR
ncbi:MAG TPA: TetM/TetW/TetO/TetS family tetracycline resistance ribosomal protection protein [Candidatus Fournierella pullicola]|uniref:TetM/TetW/TetO/TetS family tetracycline resistance ribosomal protection protein n=1 Tax=Candidatus Allofournierella pullicola TaxID=2838596 RepID=A0A9D2AF14_9FIRM|nr:TetM/TetW/TetO/TetS family tetracycline resistance ribosomal protection protein [Candidatus Fournierella pullicola]